MLHLDSLRRSLCLLVLLATVAALLPGPHLTATDRARDQGKEVNLEEWGEWIPTPSSLRSRGDQFPDPPDSCATIGKVCAEWFAYNGGSPYQPCCIDPTDIYLHTNNPSDQCPNLQRDEI